MCRCTKEASWIVPFGQCSKTQRINSLQDKCKDTTNRWQMSSFKMMAHPNSSIRPISSTNISKNWRKIIEIKVWVELSTQFSSNSALDYSNFTLWASKDRESLLRNTVLSCMIGWCLSTSLAGNRSTLTKTASIIASDYTCRSKKEILYSIISPYSNCTSKKD